MLIDTDREHGDPHWRKSESDCPAIEKSQFPTQSNSFIDIKGGQSSPGAHENSIISVATGVQVQYDQLSLNCYRMNREDNL
ncbi:MAG TPA: hypothetical protein DIW81_26440 [Planctomycetaceae bacterium]|nr:hypothetical protein [Planctomycetaceae bacterium]